MARNSGEHPRPYLLVVMERKDDIRPAITLQGSCASRIAA